MKKSLRRSSMAQHFFQLALVFSFLIFGAATSWAIEVTNTADSGAGSLRAAIGIANGDGVATTITFNPAVFAPGIILLATPLPNITGAGDTIDGTGAGVVIDGTNLPSDIGLRVRASNVTIRALTLQNFVGNDAIRVEGRNSAPVVTGVMIVGNSFFNNSRGVRIDGGTQTDNTTVSASVIGNLFQENIRGIQVRGNGTGSDGGNTVSAVIDNNVVQGKSVPEGDAGSGINIQGASDVGSFNDVISVVTNNMVTQVRNDGIVANGCTANATGSNNTVNATIVGNTVKYLRNPPPSALRNNGIIVTGAAGETLETSFCSFNSVSFVVADNNVDGFKTNNISISGGDEGTNNNTVSGSVVANHVSSAGDRGIQVSGGTGNNHSVDVLISANTSNGNGIEGIRVTVGTGIGNIVSLDGITNNTASRNGGDGIGISSNIPGISGGTPVSGNRTDRNGEDGIDINSTGYVLSNNRASRNTNGAGIDAIGNVDGGGNVATLNASCNTPGCF